MPEENPDQQTLPAEFDDKQLVVADVAQSLSQKHPTKTIRDLIQGPEFLAAVKAVAPNVLRPERVVRMALTALMRTPELADCSRATLFRALLDCTFYGLEPDGRRAHLIPFKNRKMCQCGHEMDVHRGQDCSKCGCRQRRVLVECTLIIDYKGLAELVRRSGDVSYIHADVVYAGDEWSYAFGTEAHLKHKPNLEDRGTKKIAFYSYVRLKDGTEDFVVLGPAEVEKIRKRSKSADSGPWVTDYDEMGKKTAFRRHCKWLPLSPDVRTVVERDDDAPVDISGWEELVEPENQQEALAAPARTTLRDELMGPKAAKES
jgi:recombination protein RecT